MTASNDEARAITSMSRQPSIDIDRLEKARRRGSKIIARCPACAEQGGDKKGDHFACVPGEWFACAAHPGDSEHRRRIFALVGIRGDEEPDIEARRRSRSRRARDERARWKRENIQGAARDTRRAIIARHPWSQADAWHDSPQIIEPDIETNPRHFLASLFEPDAVVWTGEVFQSGEGHADRWRTVSQWIATTDPEQVGPMTAPASWKPGTCSRTLASVAEAPFTVLDFDGFDGEQPRTPEARQRWYDDSLALVRFLRDRQALQLAALLHTGGKSIHAWFNTPPRTVLDSLRDAAPALGIDGGLIGHPEHPCRLPGHPHRSTGELSRLLWLQLPQSPRP